MLPGPARHRRDHGPVDNPQLGREDALPGGVSACCAVLDMGAEGAALLELLADVGSADRLNTFASERCAS